MIFGSNRIHDLGGTRGNEVSWRTSVKQVNGLKEGAMGIVVIQLGVERVSLLC